MLNRLAIKNYAIIDELDIRFAPHLNIITGETGAGKSIIIGALSLILGERADSKSLFRPDAKCVIEGYFSISSYEGLKEFFAENDLDYDPETILRRELSVDGKSRAFVNDTPVNLSLLKELGEQLVDIHSQQETSGLRTEPYQLAMLDGFCQHKPLLTEYKVGYKLWKKLEQRLQELKQRNTVAQADQSYLQFQLEELLVAKLEATEQESLELELQQLTHAEEIKSKLGAAVYLLNASEDAIEPKLKEAVQQLSSIEKYGVSFATLAERMRSSFIELKDIAAEVEQANEHTVLDQERLELVQNRLDLIYRLQQKHKVGSIAELLTIQQRLDGQLGGTMSLEEELDQLEKEYALQQEVLLALASKISTARLQVIPTIESTVQELLTQLGMPYAIFKIECAEQTNLSINGLDKIRFLFSANKGYSLEDVGKTASGGELSRLMFVLKGLMGKNTALPTMIFDEIDTGVSGEVALKMGNMMQQFAAGQQVMSITHLPQIAAQGEAHFFVYKELVNAHTATGIRRLQSDERVLEIAKMIGGDNPGAAAMESARELISQ